MATEPTNDLNWGKAILYSILLSLAPVACFAIAVAGVAHYRPDDEMLRTLFIGPFGIGLGVFLFLCTFAMVFYFLGIQVHLKKIGKF